jgi:hypothetical protein
MTVSAGTVRRAQDAEELHRRGEAASAPGVAMPPKELLPPMEGGCICCEK